MTEISGIAGRRAARLAPHGIYSCLDLAEADRRLIRSVLTVTGEALWYELNGEVIQPMHVHRPAHKTLSRGGSFGEATTDPMVLFAWLVRNLERLIEELEYHALQAGRLTVWVGYRDGQVGCSEGPLMAPSDRFDLLLEAARIGLRRAWIPRIAANRMHLIATELRPHGQVQLGLFEPPAEQARAIAQLKRVVNARYGRFTLRSGATLPLYAVYQDETSSFDICDVRGKMCF